MEHRTTDTPRKLCQGPNKTQFPGKSQSQVVKFRSRSSPPINPVILASSCRLLTEIISLRESELRIGIE